MDEDTVATVYDVVAALDQRAGGEIGDVRLHKLLYYAQAWHVTWFDRPLFADTIEAWTLGPVVARLWKARRYEDLLPTGNAEAIGDTGRTVLNFVMSEYGHRTGTELSVLTHHDEPWRLIREMNGVREGEPSDAPNPLDVMAGFYGTQDAAEQAWYWTDEWQAGEREVDAEPTGRALTADEFLASL